MIDLNENWEREFNDKLLKFKEEAMDLEKGLWDQIKIHKETITKLQNEIRDLKDKQEWDSAEIKELNALIH